MSAIKEIIYYGIGVLSFGFILGYNFGQWATNNRWIWCANLPRFRNSCRGKLYEVIKKEENDNG